MVGYDEIAYRVLRAQHFGTLAMALAWDEAGRALIGSDPRAAKVALGEAVRAYEAYREMHREHLPASRHDHDYASECEAADALRRTLVELPSRSVQPRWADHILERAFEQALVLLPETLVGDAERALAKVLATACGLASRSEDAERVSRLVEPG